MKGIKKLSRKSAKPATSATKNQKQMMSLTTSFTEGDMCIKDLSSVCEKIV